MLNQKNNFIRNLFSNFLKTIPFRSEEKRSLILFYFTLIFRHASKKINFFEKKILINNII